MDILDLGPLLEQLQIDSVRREIERDLPYEPVDELRRCRFGAVRLPVEAGGSGWDLPRLFDAVVALAAADANVAHLYRGHFAFGEIVMGGSPSARRDAWLRLLADGAIVGNASSETTGANLADISTTVDLVDGRWLLNGRKFYSTGTMFSSHVYVSAARTSEARTGESAGAKERVSLVVATDAPGVACLDDWDGIGQRLTGSGTTVFTDVEVAADEIVPYTGGGPSHLPAFYQLYLVAVAAGIGQAIVRDAAGYVEQRTRGFITANSDLAKHDPQVLEVIGTLSADAFAATSMVAAAARSMQRAVDGGNTLELVDEAEIDTYRAQVTVLELVARSANRLFEVGGASAARQPLGLDRHWRNLRTIASHNPIIYKSRQVGDYVVNGTSPSAEWRKLWDVPS